MLLILGYTEGFSQLNGHTSFNRFVFDPRAYRRNEKGGWMLLKKGGVGKKGSARPSDEGKVIAFKGKNGQ